MFLLQVEKTGYQSNVEKEMPTGNYQFKNVIFPLISSQMTLPKKLRGM